MYIDIQCLINYNINALRDVEIDAIENHLAAERLSKADDVDGRLRLGGGHAPTPRPTA